MLGSVNMPEYNACAIWESVLRSGNGEMVNVLRILSLSSCEREAKSRLIGDGGGRNTRDTRHMLVLPSVPRPGSSVVARISDYAAQPHSTTPLFFSPLQSTRQTLSSSLPPLVAHSDRSDRGPVRLARRAIAVLVLQNRPDCCWMLCPELLG